MRLWSWLNKQGECWFFFLTRVVVNGLTTNKLAGVGCFFHAFDFLIFSAGFVRFFEEGLFFTEPLSIPGSAFH